MSTVLPQQGFLRTTVAIASGLKNRVGPSALWAACDLLGELLKQPIIMTCFSTFWWSLASSSMVLRFSNGQEDLVERRDSPQQSEAASCLLLFQSLLWAVSSFQFPVWGTSLTLQCSDGLPVAGPLMDDCSCRTRPHLGEPLGCVDGVTFQEPAMKVDPKMHSLP